MAVKKKSGWNWRKILGVLLIFGVDSALRLVQVLPRGTAGRVDDRNA